MAVVLAFAGKIGSGKTTVTTALATALGCKRASFGDYVRHVTASLNLEQTRENLQRIGSELLKQDRIGFCDAVLRYSGWTPGETLVLDGLRHAETIDPIRRLIRPAELKIIYLEIDDDTRLNRLCLRGDGDQSSLTAAESHSSELQVRSELTSRADLVINSSASVSDNVNRVIEWAQDR